MQISSTLSVSAQNLSIFQPKPATFNAQHSPLNLTKHSSSSSSSSSSSYSSQSLRANITSTEKTRTHLSNLDKLLQKPLDPQPPIEKHSNNESSFQNKGRNMLEGLNLARIWPETKASEEMSPRHLNRLQRLLSKTAEYSPRNELGRRWREYHGCNDWVGILDPLDENLRREVVRYGEFVQAAYHSFHSDPAMPADKPPLPGHVALPERSYKVTKSLYATSSIRLPRWVDDVAPDLGWMTQRSSWIGYVAVCDDKREIQRMGRRDIVIALRGTATCLEWAENVRAQLVPIPDDDPNKNTHGHGHRHRQPKVECGFQSLYKTSGAHVPSLAESVEEEICRLTELYKGETLSITVTGHSLGAALAILVADELVSVTTAPVAVFSFGGPHVGNRSFANRVKSKNVKVLRIVNNQDVITRIPGVFDGPYSHVGTELLIDTRMSPYLKPNADVACCHDLEAYLHLVDGYLASNCPFRANAKRSLAKLVEEQRSNVKKLYTRKANGLSLKLERDGLPMSTMPLPSPS